MWNAALIMFVAMSCIPAGDSAGKLLTVDHGASAMFVAASRFVLGIAILAPFVARGSLSIFRDWRVWLRGLFFALAIVSIQTALMTAPLADVFAAFFIGPAVSTLLAFLLLREPPDLGRIGLLVLGFFGVLMVVRPGFGADPGLGYALLAGLFYGCYLTASRWLGSVGAPQTLLLSQLVVGAVLTTPVALGGLPEPSLSVAGLVLASATASMLGNGLLILAYRKAEASILAPLVYFQLVAAAGLGWAIFGDLPDTRTWAGLALILGSGIGSALIARRAPATLRADRS